MAARGKRAGTVAATATSAPAAERHGIGQLNENSLHAAVKDWYARPGDRLEVPLNGYVIDILRDDLLIEVQTRHFGALKAKLAALLAEHSVRLVYPLVAEKWLVHLDPQDPARVLQRRKSPRRGGIDGLFDELVSIPELVNHPRFSLHVLWTQVEEVRCADGHGSWRRGRVSVVDQRLLAVIDEALFVTRDDLAGLLPAGLPGAFTNRDLVAAMGITMRRAQRMTYCLRRMGVLRAAGRQGRLNLYQRDGPAAAAAAAGDDAGAESTAEGGM